MSEPREQDRAFTLTTVRWRCDKCGVRHSFALPSDADVYAGVEAIRADHAKHGKQDCVTDLTRIRLDPPTEDSDAR